MIDDYKKVFFDFLLKTPDILTQNWVSIDLMPGYPDNKLIDPLVLLRTHPDIKAYFRSGYGAEIREGRHLTILVDEWKVIKRDIKLYQLNIK